MNWQRKLSDMSSLRLAATFEKMQVMTDLDIRQLPGGVVFTVKVVPGASRTAIGGQLEGMLKVRVAAVAEKGKANQCLIEYLAKLLRVKKNTIAIVSGRSSAIKQLQISNVSIQKMLPRLADIIS